MINFLSLKKNSTPIYFSFLIYFLFMRNHILWNTLSILIMSGKEIRFCYTYRHQKHLIRNSSSSKELVRSFQMSPVRFNIICPRLIRELNRKMAQFTRSQRRQDYNDPAQAVNGENDRRHATQGPGFSRVGGNSQGGQTRSHCQRDPRFAEQIAPIPDAR